MLRLKESKDDLDIWTTQAIQAGGGVSIRIRSEEEEAVSRRVFSNSTLCNQTMLNTTMNAVPWDIHRLSEALVWKANQLFSRHVSAEDPFFHEYQSYYTITQKCREWAGRFPDYATYTPSIGKTHEGRAIPLLQITHRSSSWPKKAVWWNGGLHAREWISPAVVMYLAHQLLHLASTDPLVFQLLQITDIYITPMSNPDGYEFTRSPHGDRYWRKNKRKNGDGSLGVDLNRNWDDHWAQSGGVGQRGSSETYPGPYAFSEPETRALAKLILGLPHRYAGIDFHSYSQLILRNWGWTTTPSKNEAILAHLANGMSEAIHDQSGRKYNSDRGSGLYTASGCTDDWMASHAGMVGFTIELRDGGGYGFDLPASEIIPTGNEIWAAMIYFLQYLHITDIPDNETV